MFVKSAENFLEALENIFSPKIFLKIKLSIRLEYSNKTSLFKPKHFFQRLLELFLRIWRTWSSYLKSPLNLDLYVSKQIVTERHTNQIISQETSKRLRFWKMKLKTRLEYSDNTSFFLDETFFERLLENFLWNLRTCSRYLTDTPSLDLCVSKKVWSHDTPIILHVRKSEKS